MSITKFHRSYPASSRAYIRIVSAACVYAADCVCEAMIVSGKRDPDVFWGERERLRFRAAREHAGHDMKACAQVLASEFGVSTASQPNVSRWEAGSIKRPLCVRELIAYCEAYGPRADSAALTRHGPAILPSPADGPLDEFDRLAGQVAGEPLLGAAQLELIRGMSRRLAFGPPLSPEDRSTYLDQLRILRVPGGL
jgi:hypothetical protein